MDISICNCINIKCNILLQTAFMSYTKLKFIPTLMQYLDFFSKFKIGFYVILLTDFDEYVFVSCVKVLTKIIETYKSPKHRVSLRALRRLFTRKNVNTRVNMRFLGDY